MQFKKIDVNKDVTIIGAGMPGICAAIQAARLGLKVALVNNRGYLGGNASPEIRVTVSGADGSSEFNYYARESGIIEELRLENLHRNPQGNAYLWHNVLMDYVMKEKLIDVFLNTNIDSVDVDSDNNIICVSGSQSGSERRYNFLSGSYIDDTGDGTIGYLAEAEYNMGREAKSEYDEKIAPDIADEDVLLSTLSFYSKDTGRRAIFELPKFAENMDLKEALNNREIPERIPNDSRWEGYRFQWFYELGYGKDPISESEDITLEHRKLVYGIWNYIKNSNKYNSNNFDLEYVSPIPGKRESRRLIGDYILNENDIVKQKKFKDCIGHGGWSIDLHASKGFFSKDLVNRHYFLNGVYEIPYRSCYSKDVNNLFVASRCMSTTHVAFGTTRVMATLATLGQAVGVASYLCKLHNTNARGIYNNYLDELQQILLNNDQYVIGVKNEDKNNLINGAVITASSSQKCEIIKNDKYKDLNEDLAIIVPVKDYINSISFLVKCNEKTVLRYSVYEAEKKQNYAPQKTIKTGIINVNNTENNNLWVKFNIDSKINSGKIFVVLKKNEKIQVAIANDELNGVFYLTKNDNNTSTFYDINTLKPKQYLWRKNYGIPCFRVEPNQDIYAVSNLNNGYSRNYKLPNIWLSSSEDDEKSVSIKFNRLEEISKLVVTFDSNLNYIYDNLEIYKKFNVFPQLVKNYKVMAKINNDFLEIAEVKNNYQRVNNINFDVIKTDEIKLKFEETNGSTRVGVYDIKVYK